MTVICTPDGSEIKTEVRGIEMGGRIPDSGIPILLGSELTKDDIPPGTLLSVEFDSSATIVIHAKSETVPIELGSLLSTTEDGNFNLAGLPAVADAA